MCFYLSALLCLSALYLSFLLSISLVILSLLNTAYIYPFLYSNN